MTPGLEQNDATDEGITVVKIEGYAGARLHVEVVGNGAETVVFSHGYLMNHQMYAAQIDRLKERYRVVAYDHRGHGQSGPYRESYDIYALVEDAVRVIEACADGGPVHFVGMSTGGYVATRLMVRRPELLRSVVLIDTAGSAESPASLREYNLLLGVLRWLGVRFVLGRALQTLMGQPFRTDPARKEEFLSWKKQIATLDPLSIVAFGRAIFTRDDVLAPLRETKTPAVVIVGSLDRPTPVPKARELAEAIGAEVIVIPDAGHTSPVEAPEAVSDAVERFLSTYVNDSTPD